MPATLQTRPGTSQPQPGPQLGCPRRAAFQSASQVGAQGAGGRSASEATSLSPRASVSPAVWSPNPPLCGGGGGAAIRAPLLMKRAALWPGKLPVRAGLRRARGKPEKCHFVGSTKLERAGSAATKWLPPPQPLRTPSDSSCLRLGGPSSPIRQHLPRCPLHSRRE